MFDDRLKRLREERGLIKKEAAHQLGIAYTTYVGYENNEREPNSETLIKLSDFFNVDVDYLVGISACKRHTNNTVVEDLGLSENSINILKKLNQDDTEILNMLSLIIESPYFYSFMEDFCRYKQDCADKSTTEKAFKNFYTKLSNHQKIVYTVETPKDYESLLFQAVQRQLEYILDRPKDL
jgi:transcriptional regulator with XRE-family HTH domain